MAFDRLPAELLSAPSEARGDIMVRGATGWQRLAKGTQGQVLVAGADDPAWVWRGWVQRAVASNVTWSAIPNSARIPGDDTKPQQSEGTEILTVSITPKLAGSLLRITVDVPLIQNPAVSAVTGVASLYRDATADPICSKAIPFNGAENSHLSFAAEVASGTATATTIKLRIGPVENQTLYHLGNSSSRLFGGALVTWLIVDEFAP